MNQMDWNRIESRKDIQSLVQKSPRFYSPWFQPISKFASRTRLSVWYPKRFTKNLISAVFEAILINNWKKLAVFFVDNHHRIP